MTSTIGYYDGFTTFTWLANIVGLPIDQVNFLITQFTALALAGLLRSSLSHTAVKPVTRHIFGLTVGLVLGYFCFGRQAVHLAGLPALCYVVMRIQDPHYMQRTVLGVSLTYLSVIHLHRQLYNYGSYTLDITGPLMVITQKVTSLAYSIHDGLVRNKDELTEVQRQQVVYKVPSAIEYFSYVFHFQALMAGPVIFYRDYIDFIHGQHLKRKNSLTDNSEGVSNIELPPSPVDAVVKKIIGSLLCALLFVVFIPIYPIQKIKDEDFLESTTLFYKIWFMCVATMMIRFKYYHAWIFADAICNNSGLGFNGYNEKGEAKWDLFSNVNFWKFETSLSLRDSIMLWNMGTNRWLRSMVYERTKKHRIILTYALSALWHGFYPGYYLTFANGAFFTYVARVVRRRVRPYFLDSRKKKLFYDSMTFLATRIILGYITFSFVLLEFLPSVRMYLHLYLLPHIFGFAALVILPRLPNPPTTTKVNESASTSQNVSNGNAHKTS